MDSRGEGLMMIEVVFRIAKFLVHSGGKSDKFQGAISSGHCGCPQFEKWKMEG
jgi:hypothetical protein